MGFEKSLPRLIRTAAWVLVAVKVGVQAGKVVVVIFLAFAVDFDIKAAIESAIV